MRFAELRRKLSLYHWCPRRRLGGICEVLRTAWRRVEVLLLLSMVCVFWSTELALAETVDEPSGLSPRCQEATSDTEPRPAIVSVGIYLQGVSDIDLAQNTFFADFYMWFVWNAQDFPDSDPSETYEFMNSLGETETLAKPLYEGGATELSNGQSYQVYRVQGRFRQPFDVGDYPFDEQTLMISLEDAELNAKDLTYAIHSETGRHPDMEIPGWRTGTFSGRVSVCRYFTNFGDPDIESRDERYSHIDMTLPIDRSGRTFAMDKLAPLVLVTVIALSSFFAGPEALETRVTVGVTSLIAAVALQLTMATDLPPKPQTLLIDQLFLISYVAMVLVILGALVSYRLAKKDLPERGRLVDTWAGCALTVMSFGLGALVIAAG